MTTLVTGSEGFIGAHVVRTLKTAGEITVGLDIRAQKASGWFIQKDILNSGCLTGTLRNLRPDTVIHLAARVGVRDSLSDPAGYVETNVLGSLNLLEACRQAGVKQLVMASTSSVYGNQMPQVEAALPQPLSPYAASKVGMEALAQTYAHLYGLNIAVLRLFSVYGEGIRPDLMIYRMMRAIHEEEPITRYNQGTLRRDWTYVGDVVDAVLAATRLRGFHIINVGSERPITLNGVIDELERCIGQEAGFQDEPAPLTEPLVTLADLTQAHARLGYAPKVALREGLRRTWAWYQQSVIGEPA